MAGDMNEGGNQVTLWGDILQIVAVESINAPRYRHAALTGNISARTETR
jgi:hypothetical protein